MTSKKNSSLLVILISASQLIVMLVIVAFIYQYAQHSMIDKARTQLFDENQQLLAQYQSQLEDPEEGSETVNQQQRADLQSQLGEFPLHGNRFFLLINPRTSSLLATSNPELDVESPISRVSVTTSDNEPFVLGEMVTNKKSNPMSGELTLENKTYLFSGRLIPAIDGYLMVCQDRDTAMAHVAEIVTPLKGTAFMSFLVVGLTGFCISVVILQRYDTYLNEIKLSLEEKVAARTDDLLTTQKAVIYGLAKLAESRDNDTGDHLARIQLYVTILARSLMKYHEEIDEDFIKNLSLASSLHDIGKVGVPDAILLKQGRLTPAERGIMELHTIIGGDCLSSIQSQLGENDFLEMARQIAYYHHERWDGSGYPRKRREDDIPLCARIVSVADVYDALRTKRPYKQPLPHQESREIILSGIGTQFDPEVVNAFLENEAEFERISAECSKMTAEEVTPKIKILSEMIAQN